MLVFDLAGSRLLIELWKLVLERRLAAMSSASVSGSAGVAVSVSFPSVSFLDSFHFHSLSLLCVLLM